MPAIVRPKQPILFSDRPRGQVQADLLDAQIHNLVEAIHSTQQALEDIRRDDGKLKNNIIGRDQLAVELKHSRAEIDSVEKRTLISAANTAHAAAQVEKTIRDVDLRARDAEAAAVSAAGMLSAIRHGNIAAKSAEDDAENSADRAEAAAIQSENWSNYSHAQSDNAIAAKDQALMWAEYLAGPVVSGPDAPDFVAASKFPNGLFYQPVEGGLAGLWSAKWWALHAMQTASMASSVSAAYSAHFIYLAAAGQSVFSGNDMHSNVPDLDDENSEVFLNGVRLVPVVDYTVNVGASSLTLATAPGLNAVVQWDLLINPDKVGSKALDAFKLIISPPPDGLTTSFELEYIHPVSGLGAEADVGSGAQLLVSLDNVVLEPEVDYIAIGSTLSMTVVPAAASKFWAVWYAPYNAEPPTP